MSDKSDAELWSFITNMYKPPQNFDFPEAEQPLSFVWLEEFPCVCYSW